MKKKPKKLTKKKPKLLGAPANLAPSTNGLKLDLGCGQSLSPDRFHLDPSAKARAEAGFQGVDRSPGSGVTHVVNLFRFPWPFADNSVSEIFCFPPGQMVDMPSGQQSIETLRVGDVVEGVTGPTKIVRTIVRHYRGLLHRISTTEGVFVATEGHPISTPAGWVKADQLRAGDSVRKTSAKVQGAHAIDGLDVLSTIAGLRALARRASRVVDGDPAIAYTDHQIGLGAFTEEKRSNCPQEQRHISMTLNGQNAGQLPVCQPRSFGSSDTTGQSQRTDDPFGFSKDSQIGVRYDHLNANLRGSVGTGSQVEIDRSFAVDDSAQPRKLDSFGHVLSTIAEPYDGLVFNLITEDHTFGVNGVMTHNCSHFIEHIPMIEVDYETGEPVPFGEGIDLFFRFFDECYRILHHEGWMEVICPSARNDRAFQDPTHRRFINVFTFYYLWKEWRTANGLDHYGGKCDFRGVNVTWSTTTEFAAKHPDVQAREINLWNQMIDIHAKLQVVKQT